MNSHWYWAYGLRICSELPLPAPIVEPAAADVVIRLGKLDATPSGQQISKSFLRLSAEEVVCHWERAGKFAIRQGRQIIVDPDPGVGRQTLAAWLQGAAMSLLLHQRGFLVLHASAVDIAGGAAAFLGQVGGGKSTTAAALHARGRLLLTDDVVAVRFDERGRPWVVPAFPHLKLMPQTIEFLGQDPAELSGIDGEEEKRLQVMPERFCREPVPLRAVYVLGEGDCCRIEPLEPQQALLEVMAQVFVGRHTEFLRLTGTAGSHFRNCTGLVNSVAVCRLSRPRELSLLPKLAELVEQHVAGLTPQGV